MLVLVFLLSLAWGSFLNVVAHRIIKGLSIIRPRSHCPLCKHTIDWYDLIPIASWFLLGRRCRHCKAPISALYPFIELTTALAFTTLIAWFPTEYIPAYILFFSALIVTIRTDLETLLISRFFTLFLIPIGLIAAIFHAIAISPLESTLGIVMGYGFLWITATVFRAITGKEGMGQGDLELLAFIGSFIGPFGVWTTLLISTITGSIGGMLYLKWAHASRSIKIPFGPFLAGAAMLYLLFEPFFLELLLPVSGN